jgi:hypothetical protein
MVLLLALAPTVASADSFNGSSWYEAGVVRTHIDTGGPSLVEGYAIRFSPRVAVAPHIYIGGELDTGTLDGQVAAQPTAYRTTSGETTPMTAVSGRLGAVRFVAGARARAGMISAAAELALGIESTDLKDGNGVEVDASAMGTIFEGRGRLDLWLTPQLTIGGVAGIDMSQTKDVSAGLMFGWHWGDYDGMR